MILKELLLANGDEHCFGYVWTRGRARTYGDYCRNAGVYQRIERLALAEKILHTKTITYIYLQPILYAYFETGTG